MKHLDTLTAKAKMAALGYRQDIITRYGFRRACVAAAAVDIIGICATWLTFWFFFIHCK
jgi:hypothetical protein